MPRHNRGEVWLIDLGFAAKTRPCVILSIPPNDEDRALVTVVSHTTNLRNSEFEVVVPVNFLKAGAFDTQSILTITQAKLIRKLGTLSRSQFLEVLKSIRCWLDDLDC
jgi:mRNA interferase MazF